LAEQSFRFSVKAVNKTAAASAAQLANCILHNAYSRTTAAPSYASTIAQIKTSYSLLDELA